MDIGDLITQLADEEQVELKVGAAEVRDYMTERAAALKLLVGDPDFSLALRSARDSVWLFAARHAVDAGAAADQRVINFIFGALGAMATAL